MALKSHTKTIKNGGYEHVIEWWDKGDDVSTTNPVHTELTDWVNGSDNPYYRDQIRNVRNATTDLIGQKWTTRFRPGSISEQVVWSPRPYGASKRVRMTATPSLVIPFSTIISSDIATEADNRAKQEFVRKIRAKQTAFQGGTFLGEIGQTISLIKNRGKGVRRFLNRHNNISLQAASKVRRTRKRKLRIRELHKRLSDNWLETQFGWLTLLRESDDLIRALAESQVEPVYPSNRVTGWGEAENVIDYGAQSFPGSPTWHWRKLLIQKYHVKFSGVVGAGSSAVGYAARTVGLGPSNWLPTAWELVPYSFVVDYFSNVGDIISAYSLASSSLRWAYKTTRFESTFVASGMVPEFREPTSGVHAGQYNWQNVVEYAVPPEASTKLVQLTRSRNIGSLVPSLEFSLPWSGTQWINLAALLGAGKEMRKIARI